MIAQRARAVFASARWALVPLREFYIALAIVGTASTALALAQAIFGWYPFPVWQIGQAPGLFFNPVHTGTVLTMTIMALVVNRLYWWIPGLLPGLWLAHSRGAWAALALGLLATRFRHPLWLLVLVLALGVLYSTNPGVSDIQRMEIWHAAYTHLTFWGHGIGSFWYLFMGSSHGILHPEYAHNDYLQTVFELGIWSVIPFSILLWALSRSAARFWPVLVTFCFFACFTMPLHMPIPAVIGALALILTLLEAHNA